MRGGKVDREGRRDGQREREREREGGGRERVKKARSFPIEI